MPSRPRLVFLDSSTVDAGDISFDALSALGDLVLHHVTPRDRIRERCQDAEIVLTNKTVLDRDVLASCPALRLVAITATGTNNVDLAAARDLGIRVTNVKGYSTESVAQHTLGLLLNLTTSMARYAREPEAWARSPHFTRLDYPMRDLSGQTLGIAGLGTIGRRVADLARAFGMNVIGLAREAADPSGPIPRLPADAFFAAADAVSLHCPLTPHTERMIRADVLRRMKPTAFLINTGRGPLVDEADLLDALRGGVIAGAGLDVLSVEPPRPDHPLLVSGLPNLLITPHTAWATTESRRRLLDGVARNVAAFLSGAPLPDAVA
jgi:glycerate dehydrogenase